MKPLRALRRFRHVATAGAAVLAVGLAYPGGLAAAARDLIEHGESARELDAASAREGELRAESVAVYQRLQMKTAIRREVIEGTMTLAEGSRRLLDLVENDAGQLTALRIDHAGSTDEEKAARSLITCARSILQYSPELQAVVGRLEREFRVMFGHPSRG